MRRKERVGRKVKGAEGERWLGGEGRVICSHATVKIIYQKRELLVSIRHFV